MKDIHKEYSRGDRFADPNLDYISILESEKGLPLSEILRLERTVFEPTEEGED